MMVLEEQLVLKIGCQGFRERHLPVDSRILLWCCCGNPELCNDVMENETALLTEQFYSETAQPLLIKHTTFWRKKMNVT